MIVAASLVAVETDVGETISAAKVASVVTDLQELALPGEKKAVHQRKVSMAGKPRRTGQQITTRTYDGPSLSVQPELL